MTRCPGCVREIADRRLDRGTIAADVARDTRRLCETERFRSGVSGSEESLRSFVEQRRAHLRSR